MPDYIDGPIGEQIERLTRTSIGEEEIEQHVWLIRDPSGSPTIIDARNEYDPRGNGTHHTHDVESFTTLVASLSDKPRVFVNANGEFNAVLNPDTHADHRVRLVPIRTQHSVSWENIGGDIANGPKFMSPQAMSDFLDPRQHHVTLPDAATLVEIINTMSVDKDVSYSRAVRLDNGQIHVGYTEEVTGKAGHKGELTLPDRVDIKVPLWRGGPDVEFPGRFRYRLRGQDLTVALWFPTMHAEIEASYDQMADEIGTALDVPVLFGTPADPPRTRSIASYNV